MSDGSNVRSGSSAAYTSEDFLREAIAARLAGNAACGVGDPYPHDVEFRAKLSAYYALGGTEEHANAEWRLAYDSTPWHEGGGSESD